jgi:ATP-dependent exoDNAse (exonuclease V) alpha subunit
VTVAYPPEYLAAMETSGIPLSELKLKVNAPVMVLRNLDPSNGVCNGSRGIIVRMSQRILQVRLLSGEHAGEDVLIPRIDHTTNEDDYPFTLSRRQFPVQLAFAMTINKSQGQSMKHVGIDLRVAPFTHGQLYVALSRCTSKSRIKVLLPPAAENKTVNIVYTEALLPPV